MLNFGEEEDTLNLHSGRLCLEFANTAEWHASSQPQEHLNGYPDLVGWARRVGLLAEPEAERLLRLAAARPEAAAAVLAQAIELREAMYRIFTAAAAGLPPEAADLAILNSALATVMGRLQLAPAGDRFAWTWRGDESALDQMMWPVVRSAADLLLSDDLARVGQCADDRGCGWLFIDRSRNHSRRWCDMKDCGNRAKARRYYLRQQKAQAATRS